MPMLSQGSSVDVTVTGDSTLVIQNAGGWARVESPVGRIIAEGGSASWPVDVSSGIVRITAITGNLYYEISVDPAIGTIEASPPPASICFFGDSTTQYAIGALGNQISGYTQGFTQSYVALWVDNDCPSGAGTLTFNAAAKTLTWAPFGLSAGDAVDASRNGFVKVPGPSDGQAVYLVWFGATRTYTSGTSTVTVSVDGFQAWSYTTKSHVVPAMAGVQWRYKLASMPDGCPPGMDGIYGLGGAGSQELLAAYPQWSQIRCDIAVLQVGTNDMAGSVTADQYIGYTQEMCERLLSAGTKLVVWCTILPRNADTTAQMRRKARVADLMRRYAMEKAGRVAIFDMASVVTNPTNGQWRSGMSGDGIHYTAAGGTAAGYALADYLATLNAASVLLPASYQDTYDATEHPTGNCIGVATAGMQVMAGSGGTAGTGASGSIATGWNVQRTSGAAMTAVCSKVARTDGVPGEWQQIVLSAAAANEIARLQSAAGITAGLVVGQKYALEVEVRIVASSSMNLLQANLNVSGVNARDPEAWQGQGGDTNVDVTTPRTIWLRTPPAWVLASGATNFYPTINVGTASGGSATVQIGRIRVAKA